MTVRFTLLGGTAACADGGRLALGPPRQRVVLAVLLIEANREVAVEELEQRVWGDDPPPRARASLYSYLSRLRRLLPADVTLTRGPGGYRLAVDPEQVDVHLFRSLLERAQATDDPSAALALLDRALRLWQGEPLARYDTPWLNAWRDTLSQNRAAAELDRNDLRLELGQHAAMLADLTAGAAASPLDERLAGQLVLCLHRCGRTAEALEVYRRTRAHLVEELGIEPGRYLQACQQQILTAPEPSPAQASVPRQLPAPPLAFVGRATELRELARALEPRTATARAGRVCAISGPGGSGKTWLALRAAHDQLPAFPDGQLHVNLRGYAPSAQPLPPATALGTLLRGLGVGDGDIPADEDARGALFRSLTADRRLLVVLDNARNSDQVTPLLPGGTGSAVLVTSRSRLTGLLTAHGARPVVLDLLAPDDARRLLGSHLGEARIAAEPQAVEAVVASCAGLPLALSIVAARAVERPGSALAAVAAELADRQYRLDAFNGGDAASDLRAVFSWSYRCLDDGAARLFRLLGANPGAEIGVHALAGLAALPLREVRVLVAELAQAHLVFEVSPGRYGIHDLLAAYARELAAADPEQEPASVRLLDHHLHSAEHADRLLWPHRRRTELDPPRPGVVPERFADHGAALDWFSVESPNLLLVLEAAARTGQDTRACLLAFQLSTYLARRGRWHELTATQLTALAAATRIGDRAAQAHAHQELANASCETGRPEAAHEHLRQALALYTALGDLLGQGRTQLSTGWLHERQGDRHRALSHDRLALGLLRRAGDEAAVARALNAVAWDHAQLGEHEEAIRFCREALGIQRRLGDDRGAANTWDTLGFAYRHLGDHPRAVGCFRRSLRLNQALGHRYNEAENLVHLGESLRHLGRRPAARTALQQAVAVLDAIDGAHTEAEEARAKLRELEADCPALEADQPGNPSPS